MVSPLVVVMGVGFVGFLHSLYTNETPNTVQPKPEPKPAVLDSGKAPPTKKRKARDEDHTKKRRKTRDLVHAKNFDSSSDEEEEDPPNKEPVAKAPGMVKKIIDTAKCDEFVEISDKIYFYRVRGDGKCLFRAIVAALHFLTSADELDDEVKKANDLREQIVTFMLKNPEKFENGITDAESLKKYCDKMMKPLAWGSYTEVCAFHFMTGIQVDIYHLKNDSLTIMHSIKDHCKTGVDDVIRLFYNGIDHWDMIYMIE
jgi:hypothetical protein